MDIHDHTGVLPHGVAALSPGAGAPDPLRVRPRERAISGGRAVRQLHRWLSIVFTVTVIANFAAMARGEGAPPAWVTYSPLLPLFLLLFSGLYLFAQPYAARWRARRTG